jgi:hypothetical protein
VQQPTSLGQVLGNDPKGFLGRVLQASDGFEFRIKLGQ